MQDELMNEAQMLAMEGEEVVFAPLMALLGLVFVISLIVITVKLIQKWRANKTALQDNLPKQ
ncbi:MAG: hypothetical protein L3J32_02925 [Rhizobiaceae bacterium]|nr:hypothetical protein [Rhizobiaceae bacterium]